MASSAWRCGCGSKSLLLGRSDSSFSFIPRSPRVSPEEPAEMLIAGDCARRTLTSSTSQRPGSHPSEQVNGSINGIHRTSAGTRAAGRRVWQRLCWRDLNFGFLASFTRFAVVAIIFCPFSFRPKRRAAIRRRKLGALPERHAERLQQAARSIVIRDVVTIVTFMPLSLSTLA